MRACWAIAGVGALLMLAGSLAGCQNASTARIRAAAAARPDAAPPARFQRVSEKLYCGGLPEDDREFAYLTKQGIQTVISVDGAAPDVEAAHRAGLRYVHIPFGYDGIPAGTQADLACAVHDLPGPIYIHCHHGKHRAPAAAAIVEIALGQESPEWGEKFLAASGTSRDYGGLYRDVRSAQTLGPAALDGAHCDFPEHAKVSGMVNAMSHMDNAMELISLGQKAGWQTPADHPDLILSDQATIVAELLRELPRENNLSARPAGFHDLRAAAEVAALSLRDTLRTPINGDGAEAAYKALSDSCTACHRAYRD